MVHGLVVSSLLFIIGIIILFISFKIMKSISGGFRLDNMLFFFMVSYVAFAYLGAVLYNVFYFSGGMRYQIYERKDILLYVYLVITTGCLFIPISVYFILFAVGKYTFVIPNYRNNLIVKNAIIERALLYFSFGVCLAVFALYVKKIGGVPLFLFIKDRSLSQAFLRSEATNNFQGHAWRYVLFYKTLPFLLMIIVSFSPYKKFRNIMIIYNLFIAVMNFEKAPIINVLIVLFLIYVRKKGKVSLRLLFLLGGVSLSLIVLMYIFFMNSTGSVLTILTGALNRIFIVGIACFPWYIIYAEHNGFLLGDSFPNPAGIFPFEHNRITVNVMKLYKETAGIDDLGLVGSMPTAFPADWYVNFGWIGIIVSYVLFSLIIIILMIITSKQIKRYHDKYAEALLIYLIYYVHNFSETSFTGILFDESLIIPVIVIILLRKIENQNWSVLLAFRGSYEKSLSN